MEDCGSKTFENPSLDENTKFILFLRAMCAMERCLSAGLVHQDAEFRNIVYNPVTLQVRIIDIEIPQYERYKPQDVWISIFQNVTNVEFATASRYAKLLR